jgi:type II secretory pathway component GspD/PulD (secretin)
MNRKSSQRTTTILGQMLVPSALVVGLAASPAVMPAQQAGNRATQSAPANQSGADKAKELIRQARAEVKKGNFAAARERVAQAREADSKNADIAKVEREITDAETKAEAAKHADRIKGLLASAQSLRRAGRYDEASGRVDEALQLDAKNSQALKLKSDIARDKATAQRKAVETQVTNRIKAADAAIKTNDFARAKSLEAEAREVGGTTFKKELDSLQGRIASAESAFARNRNASEIKTLLTTANTRLRNNDFEGSRDAANRVLQLDRQNRDANRLLGRIAEEQKEFEANRVSREVAEDLRKADQLAQAKKLDEAEAAYRAILAKAPGERKAQSGLRSIQAERAKQNEAAVNKALADGRAAVRAKNFELADEKLKAAKELAPASSSVRRFEGELAKAKADAQKSSTAQVAQANRGQQQEEARKAEEARREEQRLAREKAAAEQRERAEAARREREEAAARQAETARREREAAAATAAAAAAKSPEPVAATPVATPVVTAANTSAPAEAPVIESPFADPEPVTPPPAQQLPVATPAPTPVPPPPAVVAPVATEPVEQAPVATPTPTPAPRQQQQAQRANQNAQRQQAREADRAAAQAQQERRTRAEAAYNDGIALYRQGDLARARQRWMDAKDIDPTFVRADAYLQNTEAEFNALLARRAERENFEAREAAALDVLTKPITFSTIDATSLSDFLNTLRLLVGTDGINFVIAGQVRARIEAAFDDQPLSRVLDQTLLPIGLRWERDPGTSTIRIVPDLRTEVFSVLPDQLNTIESLVREGVIPRLLYGPEGVPVLQGQEILTDPRSNIVILTDSEMNLNKFRRFVDGLKGTVGTQLIFKSFEIDERKAPEIKALLDAILAVDAAAPYSPETKLILEGGTLIIKDTPENVDRVEKLLQDQNFMKNFYSGQLSVATFNLTPIIEFDENRDLVNAFADQVQQVVATLLYAREGRSKAEREGRRIWYDPATLQLTITDYPDRLAAVQDYIESLPQIRSRRRSKIIFLDWATAGDLVGDIESFLGIAPTATTSRGSSGNSITKTLRTQQQLEFQGAFFRVTRVNENDAADDNDDSVELVVRTGTTSQDITIEEFRSEFVDDFEIIAEDVKPSSTPGQGRARLTINYRPGGAGGGGLGGGLGTGATDPAAQRADDQRAALREETGFSIVPIENLNAIFIQYENIEQLRDVEFWVKTLDIPVLQVSLEIKFVEVITNKSKEWKPEFVIGDLTNISISESILRNRFANDRDEYRSPFEPLNESTDAANLLKGTTVFNYIVTSGNSPISFTLRMLEAQGIINVVNGPTVTVLNNESAEFDIEREFGLRQPVEGATGGSGNDQLTAVASIRPVSLTVTPTVTRAGNITLSIDDLEVNDFDQNLGQVTALTQATGAGDAATTTVGPQAVVSSGFGVLRKTLTTTARIKDGGTVVLGGWRSERVQDLEAGIPILRDIPFIGPLLFNRTQKDESKITLLIFLTGQVVRD